VVFVEHLPTARRLTGKSARWPAPGHPQPREVSEPADLPRAFAAARRGCTPTRCRGSDALFLREGERMIEIREIRTAALGVLRQENGRSGWFMCYRSAGWRLGATRARYVHQSQGQSSPRTCRSSTLQAGARAQHEDREGLGLTVPPSLLCVAERVIDEAFGLRTSCPY